MVASQSDVAAEVEAVAARQLQVLQRESAALRQQVGGWVIRQPFCLKNPSALPPCVYQLVLPPTPFPHTAPIHLLQVVQLEAAQSSLSQEVSGLRRSLKEAEEERAQLEERLARQVHDCVCMGGGACCGRQAWQPGTCGSLHSCCPYLLTVMHGAPHPCSWRTLGMTQPARRWQRLSPSTTASRRASG